MLSTLYRAWLALWQVWYKYKTKMFYFAPDASVKHPFFTKSSQFFAEMLIMTKVLKHFYVVIDQVIFCSDFGLVLYCTFIQKRHCVKSHKSHWKSLYFKKIILRYWLWSCICACIHICVNSLTYVHFSEALLCFWISWVFCRNHLCLHICIWLNSLLTFNNCNELSETV